MEAKSKLTVDLPTSLKMEFKVFCVVNNLAMTDIVEELIRGYLDAAAPKKGVM